MIPSKVLPEPNEPKPSKREPKLTTKRSTMLREVEEKQEQKRQKVEMKAVAEKAKLRTEGTVSFISDSPYCKNTSLIDEQTSSILTRPTCAKSLRPRINLVASPPRCLIDFPSSARLFPIRQKSVGAAPGPDVPNRGPILACPVVLQPMQWNALTLTPNCLKRPPGTVA